MYKKITHNIVEEHFDHPELAVAVLKASWTAPTSRINFISALKNQFREFDQDLRDAIVSTMSNSIDNAFNQQQLLDTVSKFSSFLTPYYDITDVNSIVADLTNFSKNIIEIAVATRDGKDTAMATAAAQTQIENLVNVLTRINPQVSAAVGTPSLLTYLVEYSRAVRDQIADRENKNWASDDTNNKLAASIIAGGPIYGGAFVGGQDFASVIANGIIQQFPSKFG